MVVSKRFISLFSNNEIMNFLRKFFCLHNWSTHVKKEYKWKEKNIVEGSETWMAPIIEEQEMAETKEVLICLHCGKIKTIEY